MTLEEYTKLAPGTPVYIQFQGHQRLTGVSGNLWIDGVLVPAVKLVGDNSLGIVTEKNVGLIHLEPLN